jgi:inosine-uridine nucleoside N-ribohydrolase
MASCLPHLVIIDTDPGVDDALAILLALRSPELKVVGITTVCGNVPVEQATRNLFRVLTLTDLSKEAMIGQGAAAPLQRPLETATHVHGQDGLGDLDRFRASDGMPRYPAPTVPPDLPDAHSVWRPVLRDHEQPITLVTLGPLTNLARVLRDDPGLVRRFHRIVCMGGAVTVGGNVTPAAEFNAYVDPHAADLVLAAGLPLTLVPLDVTTRITMTRTEIAACCDRSHDSACRFFRDATGPALEFAQRTLGRPIFEFHDPLAMAVAIDASLVELTAMPIRVITEEGADIGKTVSDAGGGCSGEASRPAVQVARRVDRERALALMVERLCPRSLS